MDDVNKHIVFTSCLLYIATGRLPGFRVQEEEKRRGIRVSHLPDGRFKFTLSERAVLVVCLNLQSLLNILVKCVFIDSEIICLILIFNTYALVVLFTRYNSL